MKFTEEELTKAHEATFANRHIFTPGSKCGCMYCMKIFNSDEIVDWSSDPGDDTAICPYCDIDAVLSENSGFQITEEFLRAEYEMWFC